MTEERLSGVLLHPSSLPGPAIGDLGDGAYRFVDWLVDAGQRAWQILPLVPVDAGGSPYNGLSALAGNPALISPERLWREGWIEEEELRAAPTDRAEHVDFPAVLAWKARLLRQAFARFRARAPDHWAHAFATFRDASQGWLPDYALFSALRAHHAEASWLDWPEGIKRREPDAVASWREFLATEIELFEFQQFIFDAQWSALRRYAASRGVRVIGDLPIFVAHDSADVWAHPEIFHLSDDGTPVVVSGVPPDYFSETGQRWGNPVYRWGVLRDRGYDWWLERFRRILDLVDVVRVDHFRGFAASWQIPNEAATAVEGRWVPGPGADFFRSLERELGPLPVIAEDLGLITPDVEALRADLGFPGMRIFQFGFDGSPANIHLPTNYPVSSVAYTGTHDNDTVVGWWSSRSELERGRVRDWLRRDDPDHWDFIAAVLDSDAATAIVPMQDVLGLGSEARLNTPGRREDNWTWRVTPTALEAAAASRLRELTERAGRAASVRPDSLFRIDGVADE